MCHSSIGTVSGLEYGSPLLEELFHEDNIGKSKETLVSKQHITHISKVPTKYGIG